MASPGGSASRERVTDQVVFVSAGSLPKPDTETPLVVAALAELDVSSSIAAWDARRRWADAELVVIRSPWDYHRRLPEFLRWCDEAAAQTLLRNSPDVVRWNAHKSYLHRLAEAGVPIVPTRSMPAGSAFAAADPIVNGADLVVVKPAVSIGAEGLVRGAPSDPRLRERLAALLATADVLVQPFVESVATHGESSLVFVDGEFSHAVRKRPAPGDFRVQDHHGGTVHHHEPTGAELGVARAALEAAPSPCLYARVDLVATADGPAVMELELIEPALFLAEAPGAADRLAAAVARLLG